MHACRSAEGVRHCGRVTLLAITRTQDRSEVHDLRMHEEVRHWLSKARLCSEQRVLYEAIACDQLAATWINDFVT